MSKEPIEMITEMHQMLTDMKSQMAIMDNNIKLLQAKVNAEVFAGLGQKYAAASNTTTKYPEIPATPTPAPQISIPPEPPTNSKVTRVHGKVHSDEGKPIGGAAIKILNADKKVIKETTTNRAGEWQSQLKPGKYIVKTLVEGKPTQFKLFEVTEGTASQDV